MIDHSPRYHFHPPANWMNDPNGLIYWKGQYHLFYQYNPHGPFHGTIHWGHAVSPDLLRWTHLPLALAPTPGGFDEAGCWSGCAFDRDGVPTLMYTGLRIGSTADSWIEVQCLATGSDDLWTWTKGRANPVIPAPPPGLDIVGFRDPYVWREDEGWACVVGSGIRGSGGTVLLYRSADAVCWDYVGPLWTRDADATEPPWTGSMWECPQFFALGDRHVLIFSIWDEGKTYYTAYAVGHYNDDRFTPRVVRRFDLGPEYYAPAVMRDEHGRLLVWGWLREGRRKAARREDGWSGVMSLPRVLSLDDDDRLQVAPADELRALGGDHYHVDSLDVDAVAPHQMPVVNGECVEIIAEFDLLKSDARSFGLLVRCAPQREEYTAIVYDSVACTLTVDREHASVAPTSYRGAYTATAASEDGALVALHVFLDCSVVEVYLNHCSCLTERIYPTRADSQGVVVFARDGRAHLRTLDLWQMKKIRVDDGTDTNSHGR